MHKTYTPEELAQRAADRKASFEASQARFRKLQAENPAEYNRMLAEAAAYTKAHPAPKMFVPKWSRDADVAKFLAEDVSKQLVKDYNASAEQADALVAKHLEEMVEAHRAENDGERMGADFWDEATDELAGAVAEAGGL